jgi:hypothetical protein
VYVTFGVETAFPIICYNYLTGSIICGVMVRVLSSNLVDHGIASGSVQTITLVFVASSLNMHSRDIYKASLNVDI